MRPSPLQPVLTLSAEVAEVRALSTGESVGYGATFRAERPTRLAVVGMGYAHGLPRTDRGLTARIGGFLAPTVGRLSMGWLTLDVTDVPEALCHRGTWISVLDTQTTIDDLADATGVAAQEILLRLGAACQREYTAFDPRAASSLPAMAEVPSMAPSPVSVRGKRRP
jgi:alanine racemase